MLHSTFYLNTIACFTSWIVTSHTYKGSQLLLLSESSHKLILNVHCYHFQLSLLVEKIKEIQKSRKQQMNIVFKLFSNILKIYEP